MLFSNRWNQESAGRVYFNISREKPAHTPDTPHVQPLSCKLEWTNQKHFYCFLLKPIRDNLAPGFPRALDLSPLHAQKSSGSRLHHERLLHPSMHMDSLFHIHPAHSICNLQTRQGKLPSMATLDQHSDHCLKLLKTDGIDLLISGKLQVTYPHFYIPTLWVQLKT